MFNLFKKNIDEETFQYIAFKQQEILHFTDGFIKGNLIDVSPFLDLDITSDRAHIILGKMFVKLVKDFCDREFINLSYEKKMEISHRNVIEFTKIAWETGDALAKLLTIAAMIFRFAVHLDGFYPINADTSKKPQNGAGGVSWQNERSTAKSSNERLWV
ncbi:MAG TPA: hypothetical protein VN247_00565 [Arenimonas sp.]|nr:hypothetical protein [Arenimonas sp.]